MTEQIEKTIKKLKQTIQHLCSTQNFFDKKWEQTIKEFEYWLANLPAAGSPLIQKIELLRRVSKTFNDLKIKNNCEVLEIILEGSASTGNSIEINGIKFKIISRKITDHGGILYALEDEKGTLKKHEFFD